MAAATYSRAYREFIAVLLSTNWSCERGFKVPAHHDCLMLMLAIRYQEFLLEDSNQAVFYELSFIYKPKVFDFKNIIA